MTEYKTTLATPGQRFREAMRIEKPLQIVGAINANHALLASQAGFNAIYLSGEVLPPGLWEFRIWVLLHSTIF